jgi:tyrosinase
MARAQLLVMFATQTHYSAFSTMATGIGISIEAVHAAAHNNIGGAWGHMTAIPYSSFDPVFFLHHANTDRIWAFWSALNPTSTTFGSRVNPDGTYAQAPGTLENINTPLYPFRKDASGGFYAGKDVWGTRSLGYTYPGISDWLYTAEELAAKVKSTIAQLYTDQPAAVLGTSKGSSLTMSPPGLTWDNIVWLIDFRVNRNTGDTVNIQFFVGEPPSGNWSIEAGNFVFSQVVWGRVSQRSNGTPTKTQIPVNKALLEAYRDGKLTDLSTNSVITFLQQNIKWQIVNLDGSIANANNLDSLTVQLAQIIVNRPGSSSQLP